MDYGEPLYLVIDTETTGIDPAKDRIVEIGYCATTPTRWVAGGSVLVNPGVPIPAEASAVHHIVDEDVANRPSLEETWTKLMDLWDSIGPFVAIAAHNAPCDRGFLENAHLLSADLPWLDTLRMSRRWWPGLTCHTNQFLRYHWGVDLDPPGSVGVRNSLRAPHRAMGDAIVTAANLRFMLRSAPGAKLEELGPAGLAAYIDEPMLLETVGFGKHKGSPWAAVPCDYLGWLSRQPDLDIDVAHTVRHYLRGRNR